MKLKLGALALLFAMGAVSAGAQAPSDVPAGHWAKKDVEAAVKAGVMAALGGKFGGDAKVTRTELIKTMASFGRSLEKHAWKPATGRRTKMPIAESALTSHPSVTRYELAAVISRMGSYAAAGIPKAGAKRFGESTALPAAKEITTVKKSDPVYPSVDYLAKNRMIWPDSILAKPGSQPVTAKEVADAVAAVITGVIDQRTDEPQNREDIPPPPGHDHGKPAKAPANRR